MEKLAEKGWEIKNNLKKNQCQCKCQCENKCGMGPKGSAQRAEWKAPRKEEEGALYLRGASSNQGKLSAKPGFLNWFP